MFTDWELAKGIEEACRYFYLRGALYGFVLGNVIHIGIVPAIKKRLKK
jgi:hypothetical protein